MVTETNGTPNRPRYPESCEIPGCSLTREDVFGRYDEDARKTVGGMVVAQGWPDTPIQGEDHRVPSVCPIWKDRLPFKSTTVICPAEQEGEVEVAFNYVGKTISRRKKLPDGRVALRGDYQCW